MTAGIVITVMRRLSHLWAMPASLLSQQWQPGTLCPEHIQSRGHTHTLTSVTAMWQDMNSPWKALNCYTPNSILLQFL